MTDYVILRACMNDDVQSLEQYVADHPDKNHFCEYIGEHATTLFHIAIMYNSCKIVDNLVKKKWVDMLQTTSNGMDCLTLALYMDSSSSDMVKRLIAGDSNFELVDKCMESGDLFVLKLNDRIRTMVETLKNRNYTVPKALAISDIISYTSRCDPDTFRYFTLENYNFLANDKERVQDIFLRSSILVYKKLYGSSDDKQSKWLSVVSDLFSLFFDMYPDDFASFLASSLAEMHKSNLNVLIEWCIEAWYMTESNNHRGLVQKLLKEPNYVQNVDICIIIGLHSLVINLELKYDSIKEYLHEQIVKFLFENASKLKIEVLLEVGSVLGPKLDDQYFSHIFYVYFIRKTEDLKTNVFNIFKVVDHMQFGRKIQYANDFITTSKMCWLPFMAFSTTVSADAYLLQVQKYLDEFVQPYEEFNNIVSKWQKVKESEILAQFREKSSLQSICRSKIRETLLESHGTEMSHSKLVQNVKLLGLTKKMEQFVLFNYSDYEF